MPAGDGVLVEAAECKAGPDGQRFPDSWGSAPAVASSAVETGGAFPSGNVPRAPLQSAEEVELYEPEHVALADGLISLTKEVVLYGS